MNKLSPLNFRGLIAQARAFAGPPARRHRAIEVIRWRCPDCYELHDDEDEADECCAPPKPSEPGAPGEASCPVCGEVYADSSQSFREAADCCLWKDLDAHTRWAIADRVEAGESWVEALGVRLPC